tara:strand:+ start:2020 stop:2190 length:171 start_codon:yes stop_codon:yes gene_type:complete
MNKKKKLSQIHQKRIKAAKAKGSGKKKSDYVSKADRAKLEEADESIETDAATSIGD